VEDFDKKKEKSEEHESDVHVINQAVYRANGAGYNDPTRSTHIWVTDAVEDAKPKQLTSGDFDEEDATLSGIKEGAIYGTIVQQPFEFGYQSMIKLAKAIGGDKSGIPPSKLDIVQTLAIKKDGVDDFIVKINKLRGRS